MKLAVATLADCFIYDTETRQKQPITRPGAGGRGAHGITWGGRFAFVGWTSPLEIVEYNPQWKPTGRRCQTWSNSDSCDGSDVYVPQQMLHLNGMLLVANPARQEITRFDFTQGLERLEGWAPHEAEGAPEHEAPRYNAILARGGLHVLAQLEGESYAYSFQGHTNLTQTKFRKATRCMGASCGIFPVGKGVGSCVHKSGKAQVVALTPKRKILRPAQGGYTLRGVALSEDGMVFGRSTIKPNGKGQTLGELLVYSGKSFRKKPEVHELGPGAVMEVRRLDAPDLVHGPNPVLGA